MLYKAARKAVWLVSVIILSCSPQAEKGGNPVLGKDGLQNVAAVENHGEAFARWAEKGVRGATLINFDAHDDIRRIPDEKITGLKAFYQKRDFSGLRKADSLSDEGLYNIGNWIYAAARIGIVNEVYWIIPRAHVSRMDAGQFKKFLETFLFPQNDIRTFILDNGCFKGSTQGIPLTVCGLENLPDLDKPVLLTIDADFLPVMSRQYGVDRLEAVNIFFDFLYKNPWPVVDAVVAYSVQGTFTSVFERYLGDEVLQLLKDPGILATGPPELWLARRTAEAVLSQNKPGDLIRACEQLLKKFPDEPSLLLYLAQAHLDSGNGKRAFQYAQKICRADRNYCHGLTEIGFRLIEAGKLSSAERFFERAYEINPDMLSRQMSYAVALKKSGRYRKAAAVFEGARSFFPSYRVDFLAGEIYLSLGDESAAFRCFERARTSLNSAPYPDIPAGESADALRSAIRFYDKKGFSAYAQQLRRFAEGQKPFAQDHEPM